MCRILIGQPATSTPRPTASPTLPVSWPHLGALLWRWSHVHRAHRARLRGRIIRHGRGHECWATPPCLGCIRPRASAGMSTRAALPIDSCHPRQSGLSTESCGFDLRRGDSNLEFWSQNPADLPVADAAARFVWPACGHLLTRQLCRYPRRSACTCLLRGSGRLKGTLGRFWSAAGS